jgi:prophage regulatory protein
VCCQRLAGFFAVYKGFLRTACEDVMRLPRLEGRVSEADLARVRAFARVWRSFHRGTDADAFRALAPEPRTSMRFIRLSDVVRLTTLSRTTIWRLVRAGRFPAPVSINPTTSRYVLEDVERWMAAHAEARSPAATGAGGRQRALGASHRRTSPRPNERFCPAPRSASDASHGHARVRSPDSST